MSATQLIYGTSRTGRSDRIDALVKEHWPRACLLLPTNAAARRRSEKLYFQDGLPGGMGVKIVSLMDFAEALLQGEGLFLSRVSDLERKFTVRGILDELSLAQPENIALAEHKEQSGFVNHLLRVITDLKQATVDAHEFQQALQSMPSPLSSFDDVLVHTYQAYQERLRQQGKYDTPGVYWEAHRVCQGPRPHILQDVELVALDCFDDFTRSELRFLASLSKLVPRMVFGLHYDDTAERTDLFVVPRDIAGQLRNAFVVDKEETLKAPAADNEVAFAADHVFWRTRPEIKPSLNENLSVVKCLNPQHEMEWIARDIKCLINTKNIPPEDIAVILRHPSGHASLARAVFEEYGIPLNLLQKVNFSEHGTGKLVRSFVNLFEDWSKGDVLDILCSPQCRLFSGMEGDALCYPTLAAHAKILQGRVEWIKRLGLLRDRLQSPRDAEIKSLLAKMPDALLHLDSMLERIKLLGEQLDTIPEQGSMGQFSELLDAALGNLGLNAFDADAPQGEQLAVVWNDLLRTCSRPYGATPVSRHTFSARLLASMNDADITLQNDSKGVVCIEPGHLRGRGFRFVYLAHMIEGDFPSSPSVNALYNEDCREKLRKRHIQLESATLNMYRERLMLHHSLECAAESLTITWPLIKEDGRESSPSPFLTEIADIFGKNALHWGAIPLPEMIVPELGEVACMRELAQRVFFNGEKLKEVLPEALKPALHASFIESARQSDSCFDHTDACVSAPGILKGIGQKFGEEHVFSPSQLELYLSCPFSFWMKYVLNIQEVEEATLEFDPRVRGTIIHEILEEFHRKYKGIALVDIPREEGVDALEEITKKVFERHGWKAENAPKSIQQIEEAYILKQLNRYFEERPKKNDISWKPFYFEVSFGNQKTKGDLSVSTPYVLETERGKVNLGGRIDRIDLSEMACRLVDYKTGSLPTQHEIESGQNVQLHIYKWAVEKMLLPDKKCTQAEYLSLKTLSSVEALTGNRPKLSPEEREEMAKSGIMNAVSGIRDGIFAPMRSGDKCYGCGSARACRYDETRIKRKMKKTPEKE